MHRILLRDRIDDAEVPSLRASIGWSRRDSDYPLLFQRCVTWASSRDAQGQLCAFAYLAGTGLEHGYIEDVMVHPSQQRRGLGVALVRALLADAATRAISIVTVTYAAQHQRFYERCGFEPSAAGLWRLKAA
jgi:GNAT superfamily N-acetyltransferase